MGRLMGEHRPRMASWSRIALVVALFLALLAIQSWATYSFLTSGSPGGNDFLSRWSNGCALIWHGENPYSDEATLRTQILMYGRPAETGEDLAAYSYPLYALFFFWPLCFVQPYPLVQAIWMTLMLYTLIAGVVIAARVAGWRPSNWMWVITLVWAVFNYPHARALILGQMSTLVFSALVAALWAISRQRYDLAGVLLAITTIKPQVSFMVLPWIAWWAAWQRRWRIWRGFGLAMILLVGISFLLVPTWMTDFVGGVLNYDTVAGRYNYHSLTWMVVQHFLNLGPAVEIACTAALVLYGAFEAWRARQAEWDGFLWTTGLMLILTHFVAPRAATTHYSIMLPPLFVLFAKLEKRLGRRGWLVVLVVEIVLLVGQWALFLATIEGNFETAPVYLPFPVAMLIAQVLFRRHILEERES
jgi:hypothetical protein